MSCNEKLQLADAYAIATTSFSEAVRQLRQNTGTSSKVEYERLVRLSDEARVKSEEARLALEKHRSIHNC